MAYYVQDSRFAREFTKLREERLQSAGREGQGGGKSRLNLEVEDGLKKDAAVPGRGGAKESSARQGLRFAEELRRKRSVRNSQVRMVEHVGRVRGEGQVVPARSSLVQAPWSPTASAQATGADSSASAAPAASTATPCSAATFYFGANADHFTYAHVQADIRRTSADTKGNDLFVGAEGVRIQAAILCVDDVCFAAARRKRRPGVELVVPGQIAASGHVVRGSGVVGEKGSQRDTVGRGEIPQNHEAVVNIEAASPIVKPRILSDGRSVGYPTGIGMRVGVGVEREEAESRVTGPTGNDNLLLAV